MYLNIFISYTSTKDYACVFKIFIFLTKKNKKTFYVHIFFSHVFTKVLHLYF